MMTQPYQIILDTNILVAGLRSKRGASYLLLSMLNDQRWQLNLSTTLMLEYEEVLHRYADQLDLTYIDIDNTLNALCLIAHRHHIFYRWRPAIHDVDDEFLVDLAVKAQVDYIITYNINDLRGIEQFGIQVVTPKQFLKHVGVIS